jgi:hypothetical protein
MCVPAEIHQHRVEKYFLHLQVRKGSQANVQLEASTNGCADS